MATGAEVTEDAGIFPRLAASMRKVLGVDMEASAVGALAEAHGVPIIVAKGVSDHGDSLKDDRYRHFAARAAAECLMAVLRRGAGLLGPGEVADSAGTAMDPPALPRDLIDALAEEYPDAQDARALWQRAGGRGSEVEGLSRPQDLWQRLWTRSVQGAAVRPVALLRAALADRPHNQVLIRYADLLARRG